MGGRCPRRRPAFYRTGPTAELIQTPHSDRLRTDLECGGPTGADLAAVLTCRADRAGQRAARDRYKVLTLGGSCVGYREHMEQQRVTHPSACLVIMDVHPRPAELH